MIHRLLVLVAAASLVAPSSLAEAHVLTIAAARVKARSAAGDVASAASSPSRPLRISVRGCDRVSHHIVDCTVRYRLVVGDQQEGVCTQVIRVRFYSAGSDRLVASFPSTPLCVVG